MQEVYDFLKKAGTYYIATVAGDKPGLRPFGTVDIFEDKLYIQTGAIKAVSKQLHANPNIVICTMLGKEWIRITAEAVYDPRIEAQTHMLDNYPDLKALYAPGDGNNEVFYLKNATAVISAFGEEPRTITF